MERISSRIMALSPSATIVMTQMGRELREKGVDVISLSVGEPDFFTPDHVKEAVKKAVDDNQSFYPPVPGIPALRKAISEKLKRENGLDFGVNQIVASTGAKHALANVIECLVEKGEEVIIPAPYWVSYAEQVKLAEGESVIIPADVKREFKMTAEQLEAAITPKTRALLLTSPSNPTGAVYSREELKAFADVLAKHEEVYVISDEIYEHINFIGGHESIAQFDEIKDRVIIINGVSKAYAMTGYRIGYMAGPEWLAKACIKLQGQVTSGTTVVSMHAAIAAMNGDQSALESNNIAFLRRRELVLRHVREIEGVECPTPGGAFYVFPDLSTYFGKSFEGKVIENSMDLCVYLLEQAHIATVPGSAFGAEGCIRISYATSDEKLEEAMRRLKKGLAALK